MREFLRRLLGGEPRPIVIQFDADAIKCARPGDVLVLTSNFQWSEQALEAMEQQLIARLRKDAPGVGLCVLSPNWRAVIVPASLSKGDAQ